jgi:hypothetical protein
MHDGYEFEATPDGSLRWTTEQPGFGVRCRQTVGPGQAQCHRSPVAWLNRGVFRAQWWAYCKQHLYGRWIEDGQVYCWRLRKIDGAP